MPAGIAEFGVGRYRCRGKFGNSGEQLLPFLFESEANSLAVLPRELFFNLRHPAAQLFDGRRGVFLTLQTHPGKGHREDFSEGAEVVSGHERPQLHLLPSQRGHGFIPAEHFQHAFHAAGRRRIVIPYDAGVFSAREHDFDRLPAMERNVCSISRNPPQLEGKQDLCVHQSVETSEAVRANSISDSGIWQ